jgi:beta-glucanase (GH16 family)
MNMRYSLLIKTIGGILGAAALACAIASCSNGQDNEWELVWEDDFNGTALDESVWSKIPRGLSDWNNTHTSDPRCFEVKDGCLILRGLVNDDLQADTSKFITGGVYTKGKHEFMGGRVEIRARLHGAQGAWPAIWMLPFDNSIQYPKGGEIDIMERLNDDDIAYQTVHSYYTLNLGQPNNPPHGGTAPINKDDFNVYGVDFYPDSLVFSINGVRDFAYPKTGAEYQFPFYIPQYLMIDMQLGGSWVGEVDPADLPVEMEVDWVRHYKKAE